MKAATLILQVLSLLPLLAYPAVLVANAMQAAALLDSKQRNSGSFGRRLLMGAFVVASTAYPLVTLLCYVLTNRAKVRGDENSALLWSGAPLAFIGVLALYLVIASRSD